MKKNYESLCKNQDFKRVYRRGKSVVSPLVVVYSLKNRERCLRVGITTSKKIGNAVLRNRSRRVIRAAVDELVGSLKTGYDYVFVARGKTPYVKSYDVKRVIQESLKSKNG